MPWRKGYEDNMSLIQWNEKFSVGVPVIDWHHKRLFGLLDILRNGINNSADDVVGAVLPNLVNYTIYHFSEEERLMEQAGYPGFEEHRRVHRTIRADVARMADAYCDDTRNVSASELLIFMSNWLTEHVQTEDAAYGPWLVVRNHDEEPGRAPFESIG